MYFEMFFLFVISALGTLIITPLVIRTAIRYKILDYPNERKVHDHPIPRIGGASLYIVFSIVSILYISLIGRVRASFNFSSKYWITLGIGATIVFLLGLYDDIKHAPIWIKFSFQIIAALIPMTFGGVLIQAMGIPVVGLIPIGWLAYPLTVLWIVGVTNAFNLIDGLDGLAGGIGLIATATIFGIALLTKGKPQLALVTAALSGALLGFYRYNRHPAKIFLGDCGSMFIGYTLSILAIVGNYKKTTAMALLMPVLIIGVPVFDTLFTMGLRLFKKVAYDKRFNISAFRSMFQADRSHVHHILMDKGYTHRRSVNVLFGFSFLLAFFAFFAALTQNGLISSILIIIGIVGYIALRLHRYTNSTY